MHKNPKITNVVCVLPNNDVDNVSLSNAQSQIQLYLDKQAQAQRKLKEAQTSLKDFEQSALALITQLESLPSMDVYVVGDIAEEPIYVGYNQDVAKKTANAGLRLISSSLKKKETNFATASLEDLEKLLMFYAQQTLVTDLDELRDNYFNKFQRLAEEESQRVAEAVQKAEERESRKQLLTWRGNATRASVGERWQVLRDALNAA